MSKGGARVGAGSKPERFPVIAGGKEDAEVSVIPPEDLPEDQRGFWHEYAGLAIEKRTLTRHTVGGFRLLCECDADKRAIRATIDREGRTFVKVTVDGSGQEHQELKNHPQTATYNQRIKDVERLMARFGLLPFGKAEPALPKKAAANPWAEVAQK